MICFSFREPPKRRNRQFTDSDGKWQHDLFRDYEEEQQSSYQSNYRGQGPRRGGRGRPGFVIFSQ